MIRSFSFLKVPKIIFGINKLQELYKNAGIYGTNVLLLSGSNSLSVSGSLDIIISAFKNEGLKVFAEKITDEPSPSVIDLITGLYHNKKINVVIAIGGGSVLDAGKAVSAMLAENELVKSYLEGVGTKKPSGQKVPFIAVPTTSGTGSETTNNAVISDVGIKGFKKSLRHENYIPDIAIVDPKLTINCPPEITATSGMDAFTQLLEAYLSPECNEMTMSLIDSAIRAVKRSLVKVYKDGYDLDARTDMAYAAMISGISIINSGLGVIHGFASSLGGFFKIPHGVVCGTLMATCNKYTFERLKQNQDFQAMEKYRNIAGIFFNDPLIGIEAVDNFIDLLYEMTDKLNIPKLGKYGIKESDTEKIATETNNKNNPAKLDYDNLKNILKERI